MKPLLLRALKTLFLALTVFPEPFCLAQNERQPETLIYRKIDGRALKAYVFRLATSSRPQPAVLLFHGGAWQLGDATWMFGRAREFAKDGIVAIAIEYTLAINNHSPIDGVDDACAAFRWTRAHAKDLNIETGRVAGYGVSAGGHLVAAAATLPAVRGRKLTPDDRPNAMLLYSPALNMAKDPYFMRLMKDHGDPALYSPLQYIKATLPPTLIIQGEEDTIVFAKDARSFCADATAAHARCELHSIPTSATCLPATSKCSTRTSTATPPTPPKPTASKTPSSVLLAIYARNRQASSFHLNRRIYRYGAA